MFPIETSKANLKRIDYDILEFLEYPKNLDELNERFPQTNVTVKVIQFLEKGLIEERKNKYVSRFHTEQVKNIIDQSSTPEEIKKNFHFFLSQIDNPFVRENVFDTDTRLKSHLVFSMMTKSINQNLDRLEIKQMKASMEDLMDKLR